MKDFLLGVLRFLWGIIRIIFSIIGNLGLGVASLALTLWLFVFLIESLFRGIAEAWSDIWWLLLIIVGASVVFCILKLVGESLLENDSDYDGIILWRKR